MTNIKVTKMKKVTKADILSIKPGEFKVFVFETTKAAISARSYAYQIGYIEPPDGVAKYRTRIDFKSKALVIEAVPCE